MLTDPAIANLRWVQLVVTTKPLGGGAKTGYIDPLPNDRTLPFYWTTPEDSDKTVMAGKCGNFTQGGKTATTYHYYDCSTRGITSDAAPTRWSGELLLASWTDPGGNDWLKASPLPKDQKVTIYDGIQWGWTINDVPKPSTWTLMLIGFLGFGSLKFRVGRGNTSRAA